MKNFIVGITVLVLVCFVCGLILEGTKFEKSASKVLGLIVIINLAVSFSSLTLNLKFEQNKRFELDVDSGFVEKVNTIKLNVIKKSISEKLGEIGIKNCGIYFSTGIDKGSIVIEKIHIDLSLGEYDKANLNINALEKLVSEIVNIEEENIVVYT
jgi:hypothetical protein